MLPNRFSFWSSINWAKQCLRAPNQFTIARQELADRPNKRRSLLPVLQRFRRLLDFV
jgi:hypothetical protein